MPDSTVKINIIATDKASPAIKGVTNSLAGLSQQATISQATLQSMATGGLPKAAAVATQSTAAFDALGRVLPNVAQQFGVLSGGAGRLATQLGGLIGVGGIAGMTIAVVTLLPEIMKLGEAFIGWVSGLDAIAGGYDELDPKLQRHIETMQQLLRQEELAGKVGVERAATVRAQAEKELARTQLQLGNRERHLAELEAEAARRAKEPIGIPGVGFVVPGQAQLQEGIKKTKEEITRLKQEIMELGVTTRIAGEEFGLKQAEEGKKRVQELETAARKLADEQRQLAEEAFRLNRAAAEAEFQDWQKREQAMEAYWKAYGDNFRKAAAAEEQLAEAAVQLNDALLKQTQKALGQFVEGQQDIQQTRIEMLDKQLEEQIEKDKKAYEQMIDNIREGAGRVFDAMLTKGQSVFSSLASFAESVLQTMLRNVFQNAVQVLALSSGLGGLFGGGGGRGGGAGALAGGAASSGLGAIFGGLLGGGSGAAAGATAGYATSGGITFATGAGGAAAGGGGIFGGLFGGGAAGAATMGGTLAAGAATAGIAVAAVLATSYISGLFKAGENRRLQEQARRAGVIQGQQFAAPETQTRFGIAGGAGYAVETSLTGDIRGIGRVPTVVVNVENQMIDARHAREAGEVIGQEVSRQILQGGSYLADNISWAAS